MAMGLHKTQTAIAHSRVMRWINNNRPWHRIIPRIDSSHISLSSNHNTLTIRKEKNDRLKMKPATAFKLCRNQQLLSHRKRKKQKAKGTVEMEIYNQPNQLLYQLKSTTKANKIPRQSKANLTHFNSLKCKMISKKKKTALMRKMMMKKLTTAKKKMTVLSRSRKHLRRRQKVRLRNETETSSISHLRQHSLLRIRRISRGRRPQPLCSCLRSTWRDFSLIRIADSRFSRALCQEALAIQPLPFKSRFVWLTLRHRHVTIC